MNLLISGLILFLATHLIPSAPKLRELLVDKLTLNGYKISFSLISIIGIVMIVNGLKAAPFQPLYEPPSWGRHVNMLLMLPALYFFLSNSMGPAPSSAQVLTAHPMSWGVILWASGHLLANGDLANVLLFIAFWLFSAISIVTGNARGLKPKLEKRPAVGAEAVFGAIVIIVYFVLIWGHPYFTGVPLINM